MFAIDDMTLPLTIRLVGLLPTILSLKRQIG